MTFVIFKTLCFAVFFEIKKIFSDKFHICSDKCQVECEKCFILTANFKLNMTNVILPITVTFNKIDITKCQVNSDFDTILILPNVNL